MLNPFTCIRKDGCGLTDFQKNLDELLNSEYDRISQRCDELAGSGEEEEYYGLLLQMLEITKMREMAGIIEVRDNRAWWHT